MNWKGKSVLVTGADGFIGSHLTEKLAALGAKTRALVYYNAFGTHGWLTHSEYKDQIEIISGDVRDGALMRRAMQSTEIVFHLAALIGIPYSYQAPESYVQTNIQGTLNVLQAAKDLGLKRLVHVSTSEVYGTARYVPMDEKHPLQAQSPYAATKIGADQLAESFHRSFGVPVVTIRPFNTFGPRQSARAVIPALITQCLLGSKVYLGNLSPTRDFNYVTDIVEGFVLAASFSRALGKTINLGSGREISVENLVRLIAKIMQKDIVIDREKQRSRPAKGEVGRLLADNSLARKVLGWRPQYSLEQGLKMTIEWFQHHIKEYRVGTYEV